MGASALGALSVVELVCHDEVVSAAHPSLLAYHNTGLFSDFFLDNRLQDVSAWGRDAADAVRTQAILRELFEEAHLNLESDANEAQTEHVFVRPVLDKLGFVHDVQTGLPAWGAAERPDYAAFPTQVALQAALPLRGELAFYRNASTIIDAKAWEIDLDKLDRALSRKTPSQQIGGYVARAGLDTCFFTPQALVRDAGGRCFLDRVFDGSVAYAVEVGNVLRERAYRVVELLATGLEKLTRELAGSRDRLTDHLQEIERLERSADGAVYDLYELSTAERALVDAEYESPTGAAGRAP